MFEQKNIHLHRNTLQSFVYFPSFPPIFDTCFAWKTPMVFLERGTGLQPSILSSAPRMVTTLTTCGSFAIGATSPLPLVQSFCIFAAVVVLAPRPWSWLLVIWERPELVQAERRSHIYIYIWRFLSIYIYMMYIVSIHDFLVNHLHDIDYKYRVCVKSHPLVIWKKMSSIKAISGFSPTSLVIFSVIWQYH